MTVFTRSFSTQMMAAACVLYLAVAAPAQAADAPPSIVVPETAGPATGGGTETPGCSSINKEAANRIAESKVAFERAISDEIIPQNISVLQMTCFDQAAAVSATTGANIFSGSIMNEIQPIVGSALSDIYGDFQGALSDMFGNAAGGAIGDALSGFMGGAFGNLFGGGGGAAQATYNCDGMAQTWDAAQERGVVTSIAAPSLQNMLKGEAPSGGGEKFKKSWEASKKSGVFSNTKAAIDALPKAQIPSFKNTQSLCDAIKAGGQNPGNCTNAR